MQNQKLLPENLSGVHIHFVGIKGTGMAALVEILFHNGAIITGSDVTERFYTDEVLENLGLKALPFDSAKPGPKRIFAHCAEIPPHKPPNALGIRSLQNTLPSRPVMSLPSQSTPSFLASHARR